MRYGGSPALLRKFSCVKEKAEVHLKDEFCKIH